jgi:hypothetical protein
MARLRTIEDMFEKIGVGLHRDNLLIEIGHAEYDNDYSRARLVGLKKALTTKNITNRTTNVERT